jgi:hypothetical protein
MMVFLRRMLSKYEAEAAHCPARGGFFFSALLTADSLAVGKNHIHPVGSRAAMIKCSFCEQPLICKACGRPFRPKRDETHLGVYQPDMEVSCPECQKLLVCKACGYTFGEDTEKDE